MSSSDGLQKVHDAEDAVTIPTETMLSGCPHDREALVTDGLTDLNDPAWQRLFTDPQSSWFRLETLRQYDVARSQ